jgi:hypothetical protein
MGMSNRHFAHLLHLLLLHDTAPKKIFPKTEIIETDILAVGTMFLERCVSMARRQQTALDFVLLRCSMINES